MNLKNLYRGFWRLNQSNGRVPLLKVGEEDPVFLEQYKALRAKFETRTSGALMKVVAMTSTVAGEGKTLSCAKLGVNLASSGRRKVLLVDADIRKGDLSKGMQVSRTPGLTDILLGGHEFSSAVRPTGITDLHLLPSGSEVSSPADLLSRERFHGLLEEVRHAYDVVLIDTPPVAPVADMMTIRDHVDGVVFVYKMGFTPIPLFRHAAEEIGFQKILGVILNGAEQKTKGYYSHYYGEYYQKKQA